MKRRVAPILLLLTALTGACLDPIRSAPTDACVEDTEPCPEPDTEPRGVARKVTVGRQHACALLESGGVRCWGGTGLVGDGTRALRASAVAVKGLSTGVLGVSAGADHTCAVLEGGTVRCWGDNTSGQLGQASLSSSLEPLDVGGVGSNVLTVASGEAHTCALHAGGQVTCWGDNSRLQLGASEVSGRSYTPVEVRGLPANLTVLAAGAYHTCAATTAGEAWCWGDNTYGELGDGLAGVGLKSPPVRARSLALPVRALTAGKGHTCARVGDGAVECWGFNASGALGDDTALDSTVPVRPVGLTADMRQVRAGTGFTCALSAEGRVRCWGLNEAGQLGDGTRVHRAAPVDVSGLANEVVDLGTGVTSTCTVLRDGRVQCWGANAAGQLGDGTQTERAGPVEVQGLEAP
ncbi:RCC1 domain-containing protein [Myxococcus faecalis]|uniref:RCC1 domain-containing protein n=1 Tax=Myxococcus faecalis TaxID=3115646 RepID=UPI003CEA4F3C